MSFDLNELRAQRERIREHLAWLDKQIAEAEGQTVGMAEPKMATVPVPMAVSTPQLPVTPVASPTGVLAPSLAATHAGGTTVVHPAAPEPMPYSPGEFGTGSKLGCILVAVLAVSAVIFLLFGLPYLMPESAFERANTELIAAFEQRVESVNTGEQRTDLIDDIRQQISRQQAVYAQYVEQEQTLSKEAQSTRKTIRELEDLRSQAQMKQVEPTRSGGTH